MLADEVAATGGLDCEQEDRGSDEDCKEGLIDEEIEDSAEDERPRAELIQEVFLFSADDRSVHELQQVKKPKLMTYKEKKQQQKLEQQRRQKLLQRSLKPQELFTFVFWVGFAGTYGEWEEEFESLCEDFESDPVEGVNFELFTAMVNDQTQKGFYTSDDDFAIFLKKMATTPCWGSWQAVLRSLRTRGALQCFARIKTLNGDSNGNITAGDLERMIVCEGLKDVADSTQMYSFHSSGDMTFAAFETLYSTITTDPRDQRAACRTTAFAPSGSVGLVSAAQQTPVPTSSIRSSIKSKAFGSGNKAMGRFGRTRESKAELGELQLNNRKDVLEAVKANGLILAHAHPRLRSERKVVLAAVAQAGAALRFATHALRRDKDVVLAAVMQSGAAMRHAAVKLRGDREFAELCVAHSGLAFAHLSPELRGSRDVALTAILQDCSALEYASEELRRNHGVVLVALMQKAWSFRHAAAELRSDRTFMLKAVKSNGQVLKYGSAHIKADREVVLEAVKRYGLALGHAAWDLREDRDVVRRAVANQGSALQYAAPAIRHDRDIVIEAILNNPKAIKWASPDFHDDFTLLTVTS